MVRNSNLDEKDLKILEMLKENARTPYTKIAKEVQLSEAAVRKRIKKLEDLGIIKRYTIDIDYPKIGYKVSWVGVDVLPEKIIHLLEKIKTISGVVSIYTSSGDHDVMIEYIYKSQKELNDFAKKLEDFDGVTRVCPAILVEKIE